MKKVHLLYVNPLIGQNATTTILQEKYNLERVTMSELFREYLKAGGEIANEVNKFIQSGQLVPTSLVERMITNKVNQISGDIVLVGYPRTAEQFKSFDKLAETENYHIERLWYIGFSTPESFVAELTKQKNKWLEKYGVEMNDNIHEKQEQLTNTIKQIAGFKPERWRHILVDGDEAHNRELMQKKINAAV
jgi:adenylate kinase family enzyme